MTLSKVLPLFVTLAVGFAPGCADTGEGAPDLGEEYAGNPTGETIIRWNNNAFTILTTLESGAPAGAQLIRELAMVHIAMHDAANGVVGNFEKYALGTTDAGADAALSAAAAARDVMIALRPSRAGQADTFLETDLALVTDSTVRQKSLDLGGAAADAIIAVRANDGFFSPSGYVFGPAQPGVYQPVPPAGTAVAGTNLPGTTPFAMSSGSQFRPAGPRALSSLAWRTDYIEVELLGENDSLVRLPNQTHAAQFWFEQTQFGWNRIARTLATSQDKGLWVTARAFALVNMALMDGAIGVFEAKYHYNFWRPYTSIRGPVDDGSLLTIPDPTWLPLGNTPPHPEYPSAHAWLASAAAKPLHEVWGNKSFTTTSTTVSGSRSYNSVNHAVTESADSRIWAGFHYRFSCTDGLSKGSALGNFITHNMLQAE